MTLIKGDTALAKRAAAFRSRTSQPDRAFAANGTTIPIIEDATPESDDRGRQIQALLAQIDEMEAAVRAAQGRHEAECAEARERGREAGFAAATTREQERVDALKGAIGEALATLERKIDSERDLAIDIARAALDRIVADPSLYHGLVTETARRNAAGLQRSSIVGLRVSVADFPDANALAALPPLGNHVKVEADPSLEPGACIFDLSLGSLDASIPRQLAAIEGALEQAYRKAISA
ncbi:FliH/SctL family protein [Sphingopyxis sp.]|uniref:FliH/SctL family protein n=1 Tax=Sphingopyxis sp. TaxID=1908224 RepID=UPI002FC737CF